MENIQFKPYAFKQLDTEKLYQILQIRNAVFVVEQECAYQDLDDKDKEAFHILGYKQNKLIAYARIFPAGVYFKQAAIGRVLVIKEERGNAYGHLLMQFCIDWMAKHWNTKTICIAAQLYLQAFYEQHGFEVEGAPFMEDGIPHIHMMRSGE